jgi:hypothetical protein
VLLHLTIRSLALPDVKLVDETSDPGRPEESGPADEGQNPEVVRTYEYSGTQLDVCQGLQQRLRTLGWTVTQPLDCTRTRLITGLATLQCKGFEVQAFLAITGVTSSVDTPRRLTVQLFAPYPSDGTSTSEASDGDCE